LSYTTFGYSDLRVSPPRIGPTGSVSVSALVTNTGAREGADVAQLYIRDEVASITRPVKALAGFRRITLRPGAAARVEFVLTAAQLGFYNEAMRFTVEPGRFRVFVGPSSAEGLEGSFEVQGNP
jgi:beta-glucosidase